MGVVTVCPLVRVQEERTDPRDLKELKGSPDLMEHRELGETLDQPERKEHEE